MRHATRLPVVALLLVGLVGCDKVKSEAEKAVTNAEKTVGQAMESDVVKVFPDQAAKLPESLKEAKDLMAAKKYSEALSAAIALNNKARELGRGSPRKRAELDSTYKMISWSITDPVKKVAMKVQQLSGGGKGVSKATVDSLKGQVKAWEDEWKEATDAYKKGDIGVAGAKAVDVRDKVLAAMKLLGVKQ